MKKQILSLTLALAAPLGSIVFASSLPAFAGTPIVQTVKPKVPIVQQGLINPGESVNAPGPGGNSVKGPKGPRPPRREVDGLRLQNLGTLSQSAQINQNINVAPVQGR
ncbi:MAG: hypothetical protein KME60_24490 [Cyanomargarita calcarea GSE-NOS-MK-12-04C]|jgi:hypothetical protein|uniref:Uncharacterized protein n=1 Tax=Cyanomargarita calcarea GSE-NOS-MK-12-04C TaxID=2839659 RepID=A0A951QR82_9CYAN|nr:hypothetical protein [Cyanomargarita calcarea GSE-NOS-MK-12-04C]